MNVVEFEVNGHTVKLTTDQRITQAYLRSVADAVRRIEAEPQPPPEKRATTL